MQRAMIVIRIVLTGLALAIAASAAHAKPLSSMTDMMERGTIAPMLDKVIPSVVAIRVRGLEAVQ